MQRFAENKNVDSLCSTVALPHCILYQPNWVVLEKWPSQKDILNFLCVYAV